jgi:hypothetical protein
MALEGAPGWTVRAVVAEEAGQWAVVELTVARGEHPATRFMESTGGQVMVTTSTGAAPGGQVMVTTSTGAAPGGALTATMLRSVKVGDVVEAANRHLAGNDLGVLPRLPRGRPRRRTDLDGAVWAARYVKRLEEGSRSPVQDLADRHNLERPQARDLIRKARERGLLTQGVRGTAGGKLTPKALKLLGKDTTHG